MKKIILILLLLTHYVVSQNFASKEFYLLDSLELGQLTPSDKSILDSCLTVFHEAKEDTNKIGALSKICENLSSSKWEDYQYYQYNYIINTLDKTNNPPKRLKRQLAAALNNIGYIHHSKGNIPKAIYFFKKSAEQEIETKNPYGLADTYNNIGVLHYELGEISEALEFLHKSLTLREKLNYHAGIAECYNNIGMVHQGQGEKELALKYYFKSLALEEKYGDKDGVATCYLNIGLIHSKNNELEKALEYYLSSLEIEKKLNKQYRIANLYNNIGSIHKKMGQMDSSEVYFNEAHTIYQELEDKYGVILTLNNLTSLEMLQKKYNVAKAHAEKSFQLANEIGFPEEIAIAARLRSEIAEQQGDGKLALEMYKLHVTLWDSVNNEKTQKAAIRKQTQYEFEKEQIRKENEEQAKAREQEEQVKRRNNMEYSIIFLGILVLFGFVLFLGFIKVTTNVAEGLIFFAFLILFEFLLVLSEPYVNDITNEEPIYALLVNSVIAVLIFPLHSVMESKLKKRIIKKG